MIFKHFIGSSFAFAKFVVLNELKITNSTGQSVQHLCIYICFCPLLVQATAETVYDILSPTPPLNRFAITEGRAPSSRPRRAAQPADLREGVAKAYDTVREVSPQTSQN